MQDLYVKMFRPVQPTRELGQVPEILDPFAPSAQVYLYVLISTNRRTMQRLE